MNDKKITYILEHGCKEQGFLEALLGEEIPPPKTAPPPQKKKNTKASRIPLKVRLF